MPPITGLRPNNSMSTAMSLAEGTIRNYLSSAINKLDANNRTEAAALARSKGWL